MRDCDSATLVVYRDCITLVNCLFIARKSRAIEVAVDSNLLHWFFDCLSSRSDLYSCIRELRCIRPCVSFKTDIPLHRSVHT